MTVTREEFLAAALDAATAARDVGAAINPGVLRRMFGFVSPSSTV